MDWNIAWRIGTPQLRYKSSATRSPVVPCRMYTDSVPSCLFAASLTASYFRSVCRPRIKCSSHLPLKSAFMGLGSLRFRVATEPTCTQHSAHCLYAHDFGWADVDLKRDRSFDRSCYPSFI